MRRKGPIAHKLGFSGEEDWGYAVDPGLPPPRSSPFLNDPEIKLERVWSGEVPNRARAFAERRGPLVRIRGETGEWRDITSDLAAQDSMLTHCCDP